MMWVLIVFLNGIEREPVYFNDIDICLEYSKKLKAQDFHQRVAGDKIYLKAYCVPQNTEK